MKSPSDYPKDNCFPYRPGASKVRKRDLLESYESLLSVSPRPECAHVYGEELLLHVRKITRHFTFCVGPPGTGLECSDNSVLLFCEELSKNTEINSGSSFIDFGSGTGRFALSVGSYILGVKSRV